MGASSDEPKYPAPVQQGQQPRKEIAMLRGSKLIGTLASVMVGLCLSACSSWTASSPLTMAALIEQESGVTHLNTRKVIIRGHEGSVGQGKDIVIDSVEEYVIQQIWDTMYQSRPYDRWAASGFTELEFYTDEDGKKPDAVLHVNETDMAFTKDIKEGYRCPGLAGLVDRLQNEAFQEASKPQAK